MGRAIAPDRLSRMSQISVDTKRLGANAGAAGVEFRVWAPDAATLEVEIDGGRAVPLEREDGGLWSAVVTHAGAGSRYAYRIDGRGPFADPYSRCQPDGPHAPSQVVDPTAFEWHDTAWRGLSARGLTIYELHVGAYTADGTFDALIGQLDALVELGITAIELMPVAEFPGSRNWGYDGVDLFAPSRHYGGPEGLRRLVDAAHERGLGVLLDVVYNHFGPDGNYLPQYASAYVSAAHRTLWGDAVNYDGPDSEMVRRFAVDTACAWVREYHIDGLRLDAAFAILDDSPRHILSEITAAARAAAAPRSIVIVAETYENDARYLRPPRDGGFGFDAVWADDFHHGVHTLATGEHTAYYSDYSGSLADLARTINRGWFFEGQASAAFPAGRGKSSEGIPAPNFVYCLQNHDQVGNRPFGDRLAVLVSPEAYRMWSALLLLLPYTPMLFMGQEFGSTAPFPYFTDHSPELGRLVTEGHRREFAGFPAYADDAWRGRIPDPQSPATFSAAKLDLGNAGSSESAMVHALYRDLLALRRGDVVLRQQDRDRVRAVASNNLLLVHMWHADEHRLIAVNTGEAPLAGSSADAGVPSDLRAMEWRAELSTDDRRYGGEGRVASLSRERLEVPACTAVWFVARRTAD